MKLAAAALALAALAPTTATSDPTSDPAQIVTQAFRTICLETKGIVDDLATLQEWPETDVDIPIGGRSEAIPNAQAWKIPRETYGHPMILSIGSNASTNTCAIRARNVLPGDLIAELSKSLSVFPERSDQSKASYGVLFSVADNPKLAIGLRASAAQSHYHAMDVLVSISAIFTTQ